MHSPTRQMRGRQRQSTLWNRSLCSCCCCADPVRSAECRVPLGSSWAGAVTTLAPGATPWQCPTQERPFQGLCSTQLEKWWTVDLQWWQCSPGWRPPLPSSRQVKSSHASASAYTWRDSHQRWLRSCGIVVISASCLYNRGNYLFLLFVVRQKGIFWNARELSCSDFCRCCCNSNMKRFWLIGCILSPLAELVLVCQLVASVSRFPAKSLNWL